MGARRYGLARLSSPGLQATQPLGRESLQVRVGEVIVAGVASDATLGTRVALFIKEEDLHLDGSGEKTLIARVERIEYRGDATVITLASSLGSLRARIASTKEDLPEIGGRVTLGFEEKDVILIADS
jgi:ABC-type sugar transport system ATPase subunit